MSFFKKFGKGTSSKFTKNTGKPLPAPKAEEPPPPRPTPTFKKQEEENDQAETDQLDETLVPQDKPIKSKLTQEKPKAHEGQENTEPRTIFTESGENIYHILWRTDESYHLNPVRYPRVNTYLPNAIPLFKLLEAAENRLNLNKHIQTHQPTYLPYAVKVYYAIMYYMQILEAKLSAGTLEGDEASLLTRFSKKYPRNSLPCAEIVYSYFNTIGATELADQKYDWITPDISPLNFVNTLTPNAYDDKVMSEHGVEYLQPQVPMMMAMLNTFIQSTNLAAMMNSNKFIPVNVNPAAHANFEIFGQAMRDNTNTRNDFKPMLQSCGMSSPFTFGNANYPDAAAYARETEFGSNVKCIATTVDVDTSDNQAVDYRFPSIDEFLFMGKRQKGYSNLRWFEYLVEQAIIHARFFDQVYHFSDVQTTTGLETTFICRLRLEEDTPEDCYYHNSRCGMTQAVTKLYRQPFATLNGGFATTRAGVKRNEELQALNFGINAKLPIIVRATQATAITNDSVHSPVNDEKHRFWKNTEWLKSLHFETRTTAGKPMYSDYRSAVLKTFRDTPHGTGVLDNQL
uniref:Capsid protein n=1 Tax=Caloscypha fulgens partitivirus 7 TaxID=2778765 RepID=A0A7L8Y978_9VIRU|nr:capsid protein [Caloscypha fulgens partitivirus 7]